MPASRKTSPRRPARDAAPSSAIQQAPKRHAETGAPSKPADAVARKAARTSASKTARKATQAAGGTQNAAPRGPAKRPPGARQPATRQPAPRRPTARAERERPAGAAAQTPVAAAGSATPRSRRSDTATVTVTARAATVQALLVRDTFTMPAEDYAQIQQLKRRVAATGARARKSDLLRAGLALLMTLTPEALAATLAALPRAPRKR